MAVPARRIPQAPPRPRVVARAARGREPRTRQGRHQRVPFLLLALALVTAMVVGLVSAQTLVAQGSFRLQTLSKEADRLKADFGRLRLRADRLSSLERIERAGRRAGMEYASPFHLLTVPERHASDGASGTAPGVAGAARTKAALGAGG